MILRFPSAPNGVLPAVLTVALLALLPSQAAAAEIGNHSIWKDTQFEQSAQQLDVYGFLEVTAEIPQPHVANAFQDVAITGER